MSDLPKKSQAEEFFNTVVEEMKGVPIKAIFSLSSISFSGGRGLRVFNSGDAQVFVMFENEQCLVLEYPFIDSLGAELRKMTSEELKWYTDEEHQEKDWFNAVYKWKNYLTDKEFNTEIYSLEYSTIEKISLRSVTEKYDKWLSNSDIDLVDPTDETFDEITITMGNGKSIFICPEWALFDGYTLFWSEDAKKTVPGRVLNPPDGELLSAMKDKDFDEQKVQKLLENISEVDALFADKYGDESIYMREAVESNNLRMVNLLFEYGANPNFYKDFEGFYYTCPLADLLDGGFYGNTPTEEEKEEMETRLAIAQSFFNHGADPELRVDNNTFLHWAEDNAEGYEPAREYSIRLYELLKKYISKKL